MEEKEKLINLNGLETFLEGVRSEISDATEAITDETIRSMWNAET